MNVKEELKRLTNPEKAKILQRFFKTGKGEYGEGDFFLGLTMPQIRNVAKKYYSELDLKEIEELLHSKYHELRMSALIMLTYKYSHKLIKEAEREKIYLFYLKNTHYINNWDLVDLSTPNIIGNYLLHKDKSILYQLVKSNLLWERRMAILATFAFIRNNDFKDALKISELLLEDKHDLIHKAVGWMLREIGKRDESILENFLNKFYQTMPRTMLRYSLEKLSKEKRMFYMKK